MAEVRCKMRRAAACRPANRAALFAIAALGFGKIDAEVEKSMRGALRADAGIIG